MAEPLYLTILRHGDTLAMDLTEVDPLVPRGQIQIEDGFLSEIDEELARITTLANKRATLKTAGASAMVEQAEGCHAALQRLGGLIFSHLFPASARQRLTGAAPTDMFLRLDDQLVQVPWELAFDGREFLLSKFRIGRQVITHQRPTARSVRGPRHPELLKMLIVVDPTDSLPAASEEAEQLCNLLDACSNLEVSVIGGERLRKIEILQALHDYDLVHYAGHACFDPAQPGRSGWVLHDAVLTASELSRVAHPPLLVFANACQAGATTRWQPGAIYEGQAFGIGSAFLLAGTQNYIGTFCVIHDAHSAAFAADFYRHLLRGKRVGEALAAARHTARQEAARSGLLWASYMHYGNPTFQLPAVTAGAPAAPAVGQHTAGMPLTSPDPASSAPPPEPGAADDASQVPRIDQPQQDVTRGFLLSPPGMKRKLAAIFSADVQGYSRLMGEDEEATVCTLTAYREVMAALIEQHRGRVVDSPGDNLLAEFASVVDAVQCAVAVQRQLEARNAVLPDTRKMLFRIGINLGDVLVEGERIYGDGVNIAARIEGLADAGGICISSTAHDQIENKLPLRYEDLGEHPVKNIARPIRVYRVHAAPETDVQRAPADLGARQRPAEASPTPPTISQEKPPRPGRRRKPLLLGVGIVLVLLVLPVVFMSDRLWRRTAPDNALLTAAYQALEQGDWSAAERLFRQLGEETAGRVQSQGYAGLAAVAFARGDHQQALAFARQAETLDPELADSHVIRGHVLFDEGKITEATGAYQTATEKPHASSRQQAIAYDRLGRIYATQGNTHQALAYYDRAIRQRQDMAVVYTNKGHLLEQQGKHQEALALYRQALQITPDDPLTATLLGEAERRQQVARDTEQQQRLDQLVAELVQAHTQGRQRGSPGDGWTSTPLTLAFLDFQRRGDPSSRAGEEGFLRLRMAQAFQASGRIVVLEREILEKLLAELKLSATELVDPQVALRIGQILAARLIATGSLTRFGNTGQLTVRLIETETTRLRASVAEVVETPDDLDGLVQQASGTLLHTLRQSYPLQGRIAGITPQGVFLNLGAEQGVRPGLVMQVFGREEPLEVDGKVVSYHRIPVARIEVTSVEARLAQARVLEQSEALQQGWKVQEVQGQ